MKRDSRLFRIWTDLTGLVVPSAAIALYIAEGPSPLAMTLSLVSIAAILGTWAATTDWSRWRADRMVRLRQLGRRRS
jgi:hypothetical protein